MLAKKQELDRHLRRFFPDLVSKLKAEGKYQEHLSKLAEMWSDVYQRATERGLNHAQALELARDAAFPTPEPFQKEAESLPEA